MATYTAPLRDMKFVYHELFNGDELQKLPGYGDFSADVVDAVLEEAGKLASEVLFPLNRSGDEANDSRGPRFSLARISHKVLLAGDRGRGDDPFFRSGRRSRKMTSLSGRYGGSRAPRRRRDDSRIAV